MSSVKLILRQGTWSIHLVFFPEPLRTWYTSKGSLVPTSGLSESVSFESQPQAIKLDVQHSASAYVGEAFPIIVKVSSEDDRDIDVQLAVFLQPIGEDDDASTIRVGDQESKSVLNGVSLGKVAAGGLAEQVVYLQASSASSRVIDLSLMTTTSAGSTEEITRTITIPVVPPFECVSTVVYRNAGTSGGEAVIRTLLKTNGLNDILVDSLTLESQVGSGFAGNGCDADDRTMENNACWLRRWTLGACRNVCLHGCRVDADAQAGLRTQVSRYIASTTSGHRAALA